MLLLHRDVRPHTLSRRLMGLAGVVAALWSGLLLVGSPALAASVPTATAKQCGYTVQTGDYLARIANRFGTSWQNLAAINHLANPNLIYGGERLNICGSVVASQTGTSVSYANTTASYTTSGHAASAADTYWAGEPCHSGDYVNGSVYMWKVPPSCYAGVYWVSPRNYVYRSGFGWCNWWPEVLHPNEPRILWGTRHSTPIPGAVVVFAPGEQGASMGGHYGEVVAVLGNNWILISEMNNTWRGAGFERVNYRYVWEDPRVTYIY